MICQSSCRSIIGLPNFQSPAIEPKSSRSIFDASLEENDQPSDDYLSKLPKELVVHIFATLPTVDLLSLSSTCTNIKAVVYNLSLVSRAEKYGFQSKKFTNTTKARAASREFLKNLFHFKKILFSNKKDKTVSTTHSSVPKKDVKTTSTTNDRSKLNENSSRKIAQEVIVDSELLEPLQTPPDQLLSYYKKKLFRKRSYGNSFHRFLLQNKYSEHHQIAPTTENLKIISRCLRRAFEKENYLLTKVVATIAMVYFHPKKTTTIIENEENNKHKAVNQEAKYIINSRYPYTPEKLKSRLTSILYIHPKILRVLIKFELINPNLTLHVHNWPSKCSLLSLTAETGDIKTANLLLQKGVDPNFENTNGDTPLTIAAGHYAGETMFKLFIDHGSELNHQDKGGETALFRAVITQNVKLVKFLLGTGANPNLCNIFEEYPLTIAAKFNNLPMVNLLIQYGHKLNSLKDLALNWAIFKKNIKMAVTLLNAGADPNLCDKFEKYPLTTAAKKDNLTLVKLIVAHKSKLDCQDRYGMTALHYAVINKNIQMITFLLEEGAGPNIISKGINILYGPPYDTSGTPLQVASRTDSQEIIDLLLEHTK